MSQDIIKILQNIHKNSPHNKYWNISWSLGVELSRLTKQKNPKNILEIGTSNGFSTLCMLKELNKNSLITTVEVDHSRFLEAKNNFENSEFINQVNQLQGEIFDLLQKDQIKGSFEMLFLDAAQRKYLDLIKLLEEKEIINKNTLIIADNILSHGNMIEFIEYMKINYTCEIIEKDSGFLVASFKN